MKKVKWYDLVFILYGVYCILFFIVFHCVFDSNELFNKYFSLTFITLHATCAINLICQLIAFFRKQKRSIIWLIAGVLLWFLTIGFTIAQGV